MAKTLQSLSVIGLKTCQNCLHPKPSFSGALCFIRKKDCDIITKFNYAYIFKYTVS